MFDVTLNSARLFTHCVLSDSIVLLDILYFCVFYSSFQLA